LKWTFSLIASKDLLVLFERGTNQRLGRKGKECAANIISKQLADTVGRVTEAEGGNEIRQIARS